MLDSQDEELPLTGQEVTVELVKDKMVWRQGGKEHINGQ